MEVELALESLAQTSPRDYLRRSGGRLLLHVLYTQCEAAGLLPLQEAGDDVSKLHALFSVAASHGMSLACDYLLEVCSDTSLASANPSEAFMLDAECVRRWVSKTLATSELRLRALLSRSDSLPTCASLNQEAGLLRVLCLVAQALSSTPVAPAADLALARRCLQCARASAWLSSTVARAPSLPLSTGRYRSEQEWRASLARRRPHQGPTRASFLDEMIAAVAEANGLPATFPPPSPAELLQSLFASGEASQEAFQARAALLLYFALDAGFAPDPIAAAESLASTLDLPVPQALCWALQQVLDAGRAEQGLQSTDTAENVRRLAACLPGAAVPSSALRALCALGFADVALGLVRQRGRAACLSAERLDDALVALEARLANGLLTEAVLEVKWAVQQTPPSAWEACSAALLGPLTAWACSSGRLHEVLRLPWSGLQEEALLRSLRALPAPSAAQSEVLYLLLRGRGPEALLAWASRGDPGSDSAPLQQTAALESLLALAAERLAPAQAALAVRVRPGLASRVGPPEAAEHSDAVHLATFAERSVAGGPTRAQALLAQGPSALETPGVGSAIALDALLEDRMRVAQCPRAGALRPQEEGGAAPGVVAAPVVDSVAARASVAWRAEGGAGARAGVPDASAQRGAGRQTGGLWGALGRGGGTSSPAGEVPFSSVATPGASPALGTPGTGLGSRLGRLGQGGALSKATAQKSLLGSLHRRLPGQQ